MRLFLSGFVILLVASSCNQTEVKYKKSYFDFDSLITRQVKALAKSNWKKISSLNKKMDTVSIRPDSLQWSNELDVFRQLDAINKPVLKGYYSIVHRKDVHSNLSVKSFEFNLDNEEKITSPVPIVDFYYFNQISDLRKIVAVYQEKNVLFTSQRQLSLEFEEGSSKNIVNYKISGFQKMMLTDSVLLKIRSVRMN